MLPIYALGEVDWLTTQTLYHGLAELGEEGIVICWPRTPYVSIGCHQSWDEYNALSGIPVVRRKVGGTLVYLDHQQVFFQVILSSQRMKVRTPGQWYDMALRPVVSYLASLGLDATLNPPADILVQGRKISGNAGGQLDDSIVVVGNIMLEFSPERMSAVRATPHPIMQQAFLHSMQRNLITLHEINGLTGVTRDEVMAGLVHSYAHALDGKVRFPAWERWGPVFKEVGEALTASDWLKITGRQMPFHQIKVREGVYLRCLRDMEESGLVAEVDVTSRKILRLWHEQFQEPVSGDDIIKKESTFLQQGVIDRLLGLSQAI